MSNKVNDPESIARRAKFETKYLRKRFSLRSAATVEKKSDENLATPCTTEPVCGSSETDKVKVGEGSDNAALERLVILLFFLYGIIPT